MKSFEVTIKVTACNKCPFVSRTQTFNEDGRGGCNVWVCDKGGFGEHFGGLYKGYGHGVKTLPNKIYKYCPMLKEKVEK